MTTSTSMFAPAGVLGQGSAVVRPYACAAVRLSAVAPRVAVQGIDVPTARLRDLATGVAPTPRGEFLARLDHQDFAQNDGTTLGFHPSSRPLS
jgi:hypothetical protein